MNFMKEIFDEKLLARVAVWVGSAIISLCAALGLILLLSACSPKIIEKTITEIEYRDRVVHDTTEVKIPYEVEKIVTRDTVSHLENDYAKSDAEVSDGFLSHSLESKPQIIRAPVEVRVTDTIWKESEIKTEIQYIEKPLSWWKQTQIKGFWVLLGLVVLFLGWKFRAPLVSALKKLFHL